MDERVDEMGLFDKKYCCLCGAQAKMLRREKLGDGAYICNACRDKCSADVSFHRMDSSSVQTHIEQSAEDQPNGRDHMLHLR